MHAAYARTDVGNRPTAAGAAVGVLVAALLLRMLSDGVSVLAFTAWMSPFGLMGRVAPYADNDPVPLVALAAYAVAVTAAAVAAAHRRDLGAGWIGPRSRRAPRMWLLSSVLAFTGRRAVRPVVGWAVGIGLYFLILGALIASILDFFDQNPRFAELASAAGFAGLHTASGFAAALFGLLAIPTGLYAATRLAAWVADERAQRWTPVLAGPVSRTSVLGCEILVTAVGVVTLHLVAAVAMSIGATLTGARLGLLDAVAGTLNTVPVAWLALGAAVLAVGWAPGAVTAVGAVPVVGGFLLNVIADSIGAPSWVSTLSPFVHVAATPAQAPDWWFLATFVAIAGLMTLAGVAGLQRRDIAA
ncbi:hypothetical protein ACTWP6_29510 [Mycobacterium sp. 4D054]|uniref:hypothetical protein n=1 Tax=Mycobacterium sp. 4D054 TaxID=3457440 RepID=UPI003FCFE293